MYCKKCGKKFDDEKTYCPYCGQNREERVPISEEEKEKNPALNVNYKSIGIVCIVLAFVFPIASFIMSIIYLSTMKKNEEMEEKEAGKRLLIVSLIISIAWVAIPMLIGLGKLIFLPLFK